jgi:quercetin dioxygenase-like cupin family protein
MKRGTFLLLGLALFPLSLFAKFKTKMLMRTNKGFKVKAGEARFGIHYKMKGVTQNNLDIKISGTDTENDLAVFEQTGFTPNGGPPLHIHPFQDEWFYVIEGEYLFQVGDDRFEMKSGDTIFLPRKVPHAFLQLTEKGKMIVSYLPAGKMETFFKVTDKWTSPPTKEEIAKVFEDHDMKVVGPPLNSDN